ncbi:hypothetical protein BGZ90_005845, partial [Linnemannia elongata]
MSGILRLATSSSARTVLKPSTGLLRSAGLHRHALQQSSKPNITASSSSKLFSRPSRAALFPASSIAQQRAAYHDDGAYGYRVPKVYSMPDYTPEELANRVDNANLLRLVIGYRTHGHLAADLDPLDIVKR